MIQENGNLKVSATFIFPSLKPPRTAGRMKLTRRSRAERSEEKEETPTVRSGEIHNRSRRPRL
ncbi:hypothetical protein COS81_04775 [candidate division WWE3 bacterium CG06_land_8_20_14_3_00_42_16]|uniref:Uncharacterized protein n=3 Tax=Katanobacteria TaxID=422282 RepID=A0A2M7ALD6_UNCKA|nr:MAG: hypothetical protein COS81_04775 [candidate division WWE3 bacterium CG06_land_8_20_14_3_00_42_16]PJA37714.1 MAG: hypothetical protein CO181_02395 [candidate division WWE3 bacterium CG_4_9_14_3_um_filter_43_9]PJC68814.1 MAG: hypothetical protein CO015_02630 [candidate division WWE3 bacterium CG_4_8_14_3_um_filter_42_11]